MLLLRVPHADRNAVTFAELADRMCVSVVYFGDERQGQRKRTGLHSQQGYIWLFLGVVFPGA